MQNVIPVIDIQDYGTDAASSAAIAAEVDLACRETGFFLLTGHQVPSQVIQKMFAETRCFFHLSSDEKMKSRGPGGDVARGYTPFQAETLAAGSSTANCAPDAKDVLDFGPEIPYPASQETNDAGCDDNRFFAPDIWPEKPPGLISSVQTYRGHMLSLADTLLRIFAQALDIPCEHFLNAHRRNISALRLICYPESQTSPHTGMRGGAHTDYGSLTILTADNSIGGLQVRLRSGNWVDVVPEPGQFIINIGDIMAIWTNDRWVSTPHRVLSPSDQDSAHSRRHSVVFFHQPDPATRIAPLPNCIVDGDTAHYSPITYGDHWARKWLSTRKQQVSS